MNADNQVGNQKSLIGAIIRELETKPTLSNHYGDGINYSVSSLNGNDPTTNELKTQEP
ncbi:hypothetical protein ACR9MR_02570 [Helicobacter pylori]